MDLICRFSNSHSSQYSTFCNLRLDPSITVLDIVMVHCSPVESAMNVIGVELVPALVLAEIAGVGSTVVWKLWTSLFLVDCLPLDRSFR